MSSRRWLSCLTYTTFLYTFVGYQGTRAESECVFHWEDNIYNMTSLGSTIYETERTDKNQYTYRFNPCASFKEGNADQGDSQFDVAICKCAPGPWYEKVGTQTSRRFGFDKQTRLPMLQYSGNWKCTVLLKCDSETEEGIFDISKYTGGKVIEFNFTHKCACPNGCLIPTPTEPTTTDPSDCGNIVIETVLGVAGAIVLIAVVIFVWLRVRKRRIIGEYPPLVGDNRRTEGEVHQNKFPDASDGSELTSERGSASFRSLTTPSSRGSSCSDIMVTNKKDNLNNKIKTYAEELC